MTSRTASLLPFLALLLAPACSSSTVDPVTPATNPLERCLELGGALTEVDVVDNNDRAAHGDILAVAVSADRHIAIAGADGTVKLWTLEGFLGTVGGPMLTYGPEMPAAEATDLAFVGDQIAVGDVTGLVASYTPDGVANVLGGVEPGTSIRAIAVDATAGHLAHADVRDGGHVMVRSLGADGAVVGPLAMGLGTVADLVFVPSGALLAAGGQAGATSPAVELWNVSATTPTLVARYAGSGSTPFDAVATSTTADVLAAAGGQVVVLLDGSLEERATAHVDGAITGLDLGLEGHVAFASSSDGTLRVIRAADGTELSRTTIVDPVAVRRDPAGELVFVASRSGLLHALACH